MPNRAEKISEILNELSDCREDERTNQSQTVQVVATVGTILGVLFGASFLSGTDKTILRYLFYLSNLIFCVAFGFITELGIVNVLRYHYIQNLEDRLAILIPDDNEEELLHWMSFSSPILTRNINHIKSLYTGLHYFSYALATISAIIFCAMITVILFLNIENYIILDYIGITFFFLVIIISTITFFIICIKAHDMYDFAVRKAKKKKQDKLTKKGQATMRVRRKADKGVLLSVIKYFVYPKSKDLQKIILIFIGFAIGLFLKNRITEVCMISEQIPNLLYSMLVIDFFVYQARYQWNDIRGVREDLSAGKKDRLPVFVLGAERAVRVSLGVIVIRLIAAFTITYFLPNTLGDMLNFQILLVITLSIAYELSRKKEKTFFIFALVGLGYPIRLITGICAAWPEIWQNGFTLVKSTISKYSLMILLVSYAFLGMYSSILPWTHEAIYQQKSKKQISKSHYRFLINKLKERIKQTSPLKAKGKITDLWNSLFIISVVLLSSILCITALGQTSEQLGTVVVGEVALLLMVLLICVSANGKIVFFFTISIVYIIIKAAFSMWYVVWWPVYILICCNQIMFIILYFIQRYLFNPGFDFLQICRKAIVKLMHIIIGRETVSYIKSIERSQTEV